ncbi:TraE/TraK family type IV conjugative transfer system protein [Shimia sp. FJ5]|uniref:TraE/TraK family type IV conjugative transfer system protein n=1 Tax=Shimia sp. FJ5 TaxID=3079054 RepID=UPI00293DAC39|nr:TraE/TraK family type IV conjugative transfer system protein [Shimia sp. FJ5]MDV4146437.1 TraE/TraK family type IV conjugative transfer system protein [Shimia sp. FJ5]
MTPQNLSRALKRTRRGSAVLGVVTIMLLVSTTALSIRVFSQSNQVVLVPTTVKDGMVARGAVDKGYIEALALDAVYAMYNTSPNTIRFGRSVLERLSGPAERPKILQTYDRISSDIAARKISTIFFPRVIEHNFAAYEVVVDGVLATYLETTQISREDRRLLVRFKPQAGSVRLSFLGIINEEVQ